MSSITTANRKKDKKTIKYIFEINYFYLFLFLFFGEKIYDLIILIIHILGKEFVFLLNVIIIIIAMQPGWFR
jgi:hypothetical protein